MSSGKKPTVLVVRNSTAVPLGIAWADTKASRPSQVAGASMPALAALLKPRASIPVPNTHVLLCGIVNAVAVDVQELLGRQNAAPVTVLLVGRNKWGAVQTPTTYMLPTQISQFAAAARGLDAGSVAFAAASPAGVFTVRVSQDDVAGPHVEYDGPADASVELRMLTPEQWSVVPTARSAPWLEPEYGAVSSSGSEGLGATRITPLVTVGASPVVVAGLVAGLLGAGVLFITFLGLYVHGARSRRAKSASAGNVFNAEKAKARAEARNESR